MLITCILIVTVIRAQNNTLYFMYPVPQAIHTNPALYYNCRTYVELPVISSIRYSYSNSGFGYHDALHYGSGSNADSLIIDINNLEKKLKNRNYLRNDATVNIAGAGFRILERFYVHFNISNFTENREGYPDDLVALKDGNWNIETGEPRDIDLGGLGIRGLNYFQVAAGVSTEIIQGLFLGATLKYLKGTGSISSKQSDLRIDTEGDPVQVRAVSNITLRSSFPVDITLDADGFVESADFSNSFANPLQDFLLNKNHGGGIDLGAIWEYDEQLTLAASIIDLGFIRWASNVQQFVTDADFNYSGYDLRSYYQSVGTTDFFESLVDSITDSFRPESREKPYYTALTPKLYAGAAYQLFPKIKVSALTRTEFFDRRPHFALTLSGMYSPLPFLHGSLSYSIMNNKVNHLGFGLVAGGRGAQFYIVSDHIPWRWVKDSGSGAVWPYNARTMNFRLGVNLIFGCEEQDSYGRGKSRRPGSRSKYCPAYD
jgi:hypothetical protein